MRFETEYRARCSQRGLDLGAIDRAVAIVAGLESDAAREGHTLPELPIELVERHIAARVESVADGAETIVALARYFAVAKADRLAIRLLSYLLPIGVLETFSKRVGELAPDPGSAERVIEAFSAPKPGSPPEAYVEPTAALVKALTAEFGAELARDVLRCNVHEVPASAFAEERKRFLELESVDAWLADHHARQVAVLRRHAEDGTLWFEQRITPDVVAWVESHPEVLGGVRDGDRILATKIPYDPDGYIREDDPVARRRLACHCPMARSSISADGADVPPVWCSCSAGFEKVMFDVVFGRDTAVDVLESALSGADHCRFSIAIPEEYVPRDGAADWSNPVPS